MISDRSITRYDLDALYDQYNRRERVYPDPLVFLYSYADIRDREIVGLLASSLAYGRVAQIYKSLCCVLEKMGHSPLSFLNRSTRRSLTAAYSGFSHRFATSGDLVNLMLAIKDILNRYGSIHGCFVSGLTIEDETVLPALTRFVAALTAGNALGLGHLIPLPERGSACKRLNLFLRWMVRRDDVDPGGWDQVPASKLIIPLDVHMHRVGVYLRFTRRKQADMRTALEITRAFSRMIPEDPLRYDFTLCRMGMIGVNIF
ncbi:MAG: TIGR02757 family protein [Pseudomonadota bacterium]